MADEETHVTFCNADYEAIEAAVMETARGRWFLREYARRNRNADTEAVLSALARLEETLADDQPARILESIRASLQNMAAAIVQTKGEIGLIPEGDKTVPGDPLEALAQGIEASSDEEFQAIAEQRIRRILQTLRYLEGRIHGMMAICDTDRTLGDADHSPADPSRRPDEAAIHPVQHPSFLM